VSSLLEALQSITPRGPYLARNAVAVAQMVLAELAGRIAERFEQFGDGWIFLLKSKRSTGQADFGHAGAQPRLTGDEGGSSRRAALLGVIISEHHSFVRDAVDVGRLIAHQAARVGADIRLPNVVTPDDDDVCFRLLLCCRWYANERHRKQPCQQCK